MVDLNLPLWFVSGPAPPESVNDIAVNPVVGFTSPKKLMEYLRHHHLGIKAAEFANSYSDLIRVISDLHLIGQGTVCFDPGGDGLAGRTVEIQDLLAIANRFRTDPTTQ